MTENGPTPAPRLLSYEQTIPGGRYVVDHLLGTGAFSEVYLVRHPILGRLAMKVFREVSTSQRANTILREAVLLSRLGHPNIVRLFDAGTAPTPSGRRAWFTTEYVAGGSLEDFRLRHTSGPIPTATTVDILMQACAGLAVAHREDPPIVHRDLTPWNILVSDDFRGLRVIVSDFGLAEHIDPRTGHTSGGGTLAFTAPEALQYGVGASTSGDVYSLGVIAYLLLADAMPWEDIIFTRYGAINRQPPLRPSRFNSAVDPRLEEVVLRALAPDPADRYPDADAFAAELRAWRDHTVSISSDQESA